MRKMNSSKGNKMFKKIIVILLTLSALSCAGNNQNKISKEEVLNYMEEYFEKVKLNDFSLIQPYYTDEFYKSTSKEAWQETLDTIHSAAGNLISAELVSYGVKTTLSTEGSGTNYILGYKNLYENAEIKETVNLYKSKGSKDIGIIEHRFDTDVLPDTLPGKEEEKVQVCLAL